MASYYDTLDSRQRDNIAYMIKRMNAKGITNPFTQAGILSVVSKESSFVPKSEISYRSTPNDRIRSIFGSKLTGYTDAQLTALKQDDKAFFDAVYGGRYGNGPDEGYKYRGRGFNQLTFKSNYKAIGDAIGVDLVNNPDKLNTVPVATDALIEYFVKRYKAPENKLASYNAKDINDFKTIEDSVSAAYHANAGWGKEVTEIKADSTGGRAKAISRAPGFYDVVKNYVGSTIDTVKKKPLIALAVVLVGTIAVALIISQFNTSNS